MSVIDKGVVLPRLGFLSAWDMLALGDPHPVLGADRDFWMADDAVRDLERRTMAWLTERGLARNGRLNALWKDTLRTVAEASAEFYGWSHYRDGSHGGILVAVRGEAAVRMFADRDTVILQPANASRPATALFDGLPPVDGARVRRVMMTKSFFDDPFAKPDDPLADSIDTSELDYFNQVVAEPRDAVHQLYVAHRDSEGNRRRSSPITALDLTARGRVLTYLSGDDEVVLVSGTPRETVLTLNTTQSGLVTR